MSGDKSICTSSSSNGIPSKKKPDKSPALIVVYALVTGLCVFMVGWILIFPASVLHEHSEYHRKLLDYFYFVNQERGNGDGVTSPELMTKYRGEHWVQCLHILPGALWAALIPGQMHSTFRKNYRYLHKVLGYVFAGTAFVMGVGVAVIVHKGLLYENFYPDLEPLPLSKAPFLLALTVYFVGTMAASIYQAAIRRDFHRHRMWIVRHVAAGLWIALQRVLLGTVYNRPPFTREQQRDVFGTAAFTAVAITLVTGEFTVHLLNLQQAEKMRRKAAKGKVKKGS